jgi:phospholipid-binding lipoprotein MlaA
MPETSLETASSYDTQDPFEPLNRVIFDFNYWLDKLILLNIAKIYLSVTPPPLQEGISNALYTLTLPITTLNHLLQGNIEDASDSFGTFLFNMVFGLFGFVDIAQSTGMKKTFNDFGKTFSFMGVPSGPYLMLPVYGPTNPRDLCGTVLDWISSPFNIICRHSHSNAPYAATSLNMVSRRANNINFLDRIERESFDLYITVRSLYTQSRSTVEDTLEEGPRPFAWDAQEDLL